MPEERKSNTFLVIAIALLAKSAKLLKLLKVAKPMVLFVTMSISAIAYTFLWGPWLAILFVLLLLVHEMGHVVAMRLKGFDTPTPVFIPFLGAAIFAPKFTDRHTEAFVGFGGPVLGTVGALAVFGLYFLVPDKDTPLAHILLVGSYLGVFLNLFNLLPISPLDGGRVTQATGRWFKYIGLLLLALLSIVWREPVILYIWILVLFDFESIPIQVRALLCSICWIAMATLMTLGYGEQPVWINIVDCVITAPFVALIVYSAIKQKDLPPPEKDNRPNLESGQRIQWLVLWLGLGVILIATLFFQAPLLPQPQ